MEEALTPTAIVGIFMGEKEAGKENTLTVSVKNQTGNEMFVKMRHSTKMRKMFDSYAARKGVPPHHLRYVFNGALIHGGQTPGQLEMEEGDMIDVALVEDE